MVEWKIRPNHAEEYDLHKLYDGNPSMFSMKIHHGGMIKNVGGSSFYSGKRSMVDYVDPDCLSVIEFHHIMTELGYKLETIRSYKFDIPDCHMDSGMCDLNNDRDIVNMGSMVGGHYKLINVYVEHDPKSLTPRLTKSAAMRLSSNVQSRKVFFSEVGTSNVDPFKEFETGNVELGEDEEHSVNGDEEDAVNEDEDVIVEHDNEVVDVDVDMTDYMLNLDAQNPVEHIGLNEQVSHQEADEVPIIDNEVFESGSETDGDNPDSVKARKLSQFRKDQRTKCGGSTDNAPFYPYQEFGSPAEVKELIKKYSVESRRCIKIIYNDKRRVRAICEGCVPVLQSNKKTGTSQRKKGSTSGLKQKEVVGPEQEPKSNKKGKSKTFSGGQEAELKGTQTLNTCPWVLHVSKIPDSLTWMVKTFIPKHECLQSREIKHCTFNYMSKQIREQIRGNREIPTSALQSELEQKLQLSVSWMKVFRAKKKAATDLRGDYQQQYSLLRNYCEELMLQNPGSTVVIDVDRVINSTATSRQFKRIYVCLGPLKQGFKACRRDLIGVDGAFMKGPYSGQVLTAVGVDSNNGIYPVAYAIVEAENKESWTWFLECLGPDIDLDVRSNFTFISDRQKGLIQAVSKVFPSAEHRYCLKHIHENMKLHWRGRAYKNILWRCATATTPLQFQQHMEEMKRLNVEAYNWLAKIPPKHWSRSHFSGRCKSDMLLNNLCEVLNKQLVHGRDKPIIAAIDFIREYFMKRIVLVQKAIDKAMGPLMYQNKQEASKCITLWNGGDKYQVSGPWGDQQIVDVNAMGCTCRKWELTGLPCKHAIAVFWDMVKNRQQSGIVENWAHPCYWLETWKTAYTFKVGPITGTHSWPKSNCPYTLTPPAHHKPVGRPKKKRTRGVYEESNMVKNGKVTRMMATVTCSKCHKKGHNARACTGQGGGSQVGSQVDGGSQVRGF